MIIYSGFYDDREEWNKRHNDLWLLKCKDDVSLVYEWILLDKNPQKLTYPALISAFASTLVYVYGYSAKGRAMWSYRVSTAT